MVIKNENDSKVSLLHWIKINEFMFLRYTEFILCFQFVSLWGKGIAFLGSFPFRLNY
jgi:hypothetical protein